MDDFTRGALEMQRVAAEAMDALAAQAEDALRNTSKGIDQGFLWNRLKEKRDYYRDAARIIRSIKVEEATVRG